ncbi:Uncharacterised protein [Mycobacteroides abscessus]|nr:Uncharacterised protein [Mycobacteroides abscessus]
MDADGSGITAIPQPRAAAQTATNSSAAINPLGNTMIWWAPLSTTASNRRFALAGGSSTRKT